MLSDEMREHLCNRLIPFWIKLRDTEHGGYYGWVDSELHVHREAVKGCPIRRILQIGLRPPAGFLPAAFLISTGSFQAVFRIPLRSLPTAFRIPFRSLPAAFRIPLRSPPAAFRIPLRSLPAAFRTFIELLPSAFLLSFRFRRSVLPCFPQRALFAGEMY